MKKGITNILLPVSSRPPAIDPCVVDQVKY